MPQNKRIASLSPSLSSRSPLLIRFVLQWIFICSHCRSPNRPHYQCFFRSAAFTFHKYFWTCLNRKLVAFEVIFLSSNSCAVCKEVRRVTNSNMVWQRDRTMTAKERCKIIKASQNICKCQIFGLCDTLCVCTCEILLGVNRQLRSRWEIWCICG